MQSWNNEPEFQTWGHLFSYHGDFLNFEVYYRFEESPEGYVRVKFREEVMGSESCSDNGLRTIEEAREYVKQFKEKLMKLASYEQELGFY